MAKPDVLHTDHGTFGLTLVGADPDGQNGFVRGMTTTSDGYLALTGVASKPFKTVGGAERWLALRGYDRFGRSSPQNP